jgi:P-type Cu+ transporter
LGSSSFIQGKKHNTGETRVYIKIDEEILGYFEFTNQYRTSSKDVINELINNQLEVAVLSGDNDKEKETIQAMIGVQHEALFNQDPHEKLLYIKESAKYNKIAMVGDGLNDAGALQAADVGIVIAEETNNFTPASDIIIDASQFDYLGKLFQMTSRVKYILTGAYGVAIAYNIVGLSYAVSGNLSPVIAAILMPLSSLTMVAYSLASSTLLYKNHFTSIKK